MSEKRKRGQELGLKHEIQALKRRKRYVKKELKQLNAKIQESQIQLKAKRKLHDVTSFLFLCSVLPCRLISFLFLGKETKRTI